MFQVEYIRNDGATQYINTGIYANQDTRVVVHVKNTGNCAYWFGAWNYAFNNGAYACGNDGGNIYSGYDGQGGGYGSTVSGENVIDMNKNVITINGTVHRTFSYTNFSVNYPLYIFGQNRAGTFAIRDNASRPYSTFELTALEIYQNDVLVREYIPAYDDQTGDIGLYDKVSEQLFKNAGSGTFTRGDIIRPIGGGKYLISDDQNKLYTIVNDTLTEITNGSINAATFETYGFENMPQWEDFDTLTNPKVLYYTDNAQDEITVIATQTAVPFPQIITSGDYDLTDITILGIEDADVVASSDVLFGISFDGGTTWKAHNGTQWVTLSSSDSGMNAETFNAIDVEAWEEIATGAQQFRIRARLPANTSYITSVVINFIN